MPLATRSCNSSHQHTYTGKSNLSTNFNDKNTPVADACSAHAERWVQILACIAVAERLRSRTLVTVVNLCVCIAGGCYRDFERGP